MEGNFESEKIARESILKESKEIDGVSIKGYDFNSGVDYEKIVKSFGSTGFQASHLGKAIEIVNKMIEDDVSVFFGCTSNLITSGIRDVVKYLAENRKIDAFVTTAGGIEEDIIKCFGDFKLGKFSASGELLREKGVNRTGNIFVPNSRYIKYEEFMIPILEKIYKEQKETGEIISVSDFIKILGKEINDERSILYWCWKNDIKVYCPAITDGSTGDMIHFFMYKNPEFKLDVAKDIHDLNEYAITREKTGMIILGGGAMKHHICNANLMRNGADYAVYINAGEEWDGADSNARPDEAVSWGKMKGSEGDSIKVFGDATILFPLLVAESFAKSK